jgi:1-pyrroline-5-carboxylate dehydrogenase
MTLPEFRNEPPLDFSQDTQHKAMLAAITAVQSRLGREFPLVIAGRRLQPSGKFESINPAQPDQIVAVAPAATTEQVDQAVDAAAAAFLEWRGTPPEGRAAVLLRAASLLRRRRLETAAWLIFEVGKNWPEADGEVAWAIDLLEFFARDLLRYAEGKPLYPHNEEMSSYSYEPIGVIAVISPWNFPLALPMGMTLGAVAAGNTVVLKPSSDSPVPAYLFLEVMEEAGLPEGVITVMTGSGSVVGDSLVTHPRVRMAAFTGSKEIGCRIYEQAARIQPGQTWLRRVIAEMGGKNAIVVGEDADVDEAVAAAIASGYSYQGQKCSAASRLILTSGIHDGILEKFVAGVRSLDIGPGKDNHAFGPVINKRAMQSILEYMRTGMREGQLLAGGEPWGAGGYYIQPTVFGNVPPRARIAQEEIFGPVVAVIRARDFDDALRIANDTEFGLTGSVFTRDPKKIAQARAEFACGNLYINRKCTGAQTGVHPFGGFNMSGTDAKVGGPDYLLNFLQPKVTTIRYR